MERNGSDRTPFVHPSRAHLFRKPPIPDDTFKHTSVKHVSRTWNNRRDRANDKQENDQLLVFGYASKIFPPDEHSSSIAKNKHLIVWNEDFQLNLLIDRYDCRASLHNLSEFDADNWNKTHQLSDEESKLEAHLDEERYRALFVEELEEDIRHEEELKRLHASIADEDSGYAQVKYEYDAESEDQYDPTEPTNDDDDDHKVFIAPLTLAVPKEMEIPATDKMHAIIEKTANFVSKQGTQMEIVLKAKQANNSQFQFLQFDHYLNPYYKHMVKRIKDGKYTPGIEQEDTKEEESSDDDDDGDGGYLHPSLFASSHKKNEADQKEKTKAIRTIDPEHPLAKLIERGRQANAIKQYQRMAEAVFNYYQQQGTYTSQANSTTLEPPPLPTFMTMAGLHTSTETTSANQLCLSNSLTLAPSGDGGQQHPPSIDTSDLQWKSDAPIVPPPPDLQEVVEEIAKKVAIEGKDTEKALVIQADADYSFLNPWHELHPYYQYRKVAWLQVLHPPPPPTADTKQEKSTQIEKEGEEKDDDVDDTSKDSTKSATVPISFSIKTRKEGLLKPLSAAPSSALDDAASDDEEGETSETKKNEQQKKAKPTRRRFTDHPPDPSPPHTEVPSAPSMQAVPAPVEKKAMQTINSPKSHLATTTAPSKVGRSPPPITTAPPSTFTAVTPSGGAASISLLREKQAERRRKAILFLQSKTNAMSKEEEVVKSPHLSDEDNKLSAAASEDIFDLSIPSEEELPPSERNDETEEVPPDKPFLSKVELLQKIYSVSPSRSSSPHSVSSGKSKQRRSRSPPSGMKSSRRRSQTRDLESLYSQSRSIKRDLESLVTPTRHSSTPSSGDDSEEVPSAYRVAAAKRDRATRSASAHKRSRKRSRDRDTKRHKRSRGERSSRSSKHKRSSDRSSRDQGKRKKRKKERKTRKSRRRTSSSSSSSSDDAVNLNVGGCVDEEPPKLGEASGDLEMKNMIFEVKNNMDESTHEVVAQESTTSDGEIVSE